MKRMAIVTLGLVLVAMPAGTVVQPPDALASSTSSAPGITYHVATTGTNRSCAAGRSGATPLRTIGFAVACANRHRTTRSRPITIVIARGTYDENNLTIAANVHLQGASSVTIDGQLNPGKGILEKPIVAVDGAVTVAINNVSLTDGGNGTALANNGGTVTFSNGAISNNVGTQNPPEGGSSGDAITNFGTMTVRNATISGNVSTVLGGAIFNAGGNMTIINSALTGNSTNCEGKDGCTGATGGAIWNGGTLRVTNSKIANNTVTCNVARCFASGAGILNGKYKRTTGTVTVGKNSQVDSNTASCSGSSCTVTGGGILNAYGPLKVQNSQVEGNTASCTGSSCSAHGGGIYNNPTAPVVGTVTIVSSRVSTNTPDNCEPTGTIAGCTG